ncbi:hypothetical protein Tco_0588745 [Tanacetum coccineum]
MQINVCCHRNTFKKEIQLPRKLQTTLFQSQYEIPYFQWHQVQSLLDSIFNRLQKIVSNLAILGVSCPRKLVNLKILSSLPPRWNTHVVLWMNKPEVETMSMDDLYYNFKIVEQKIKKSVGASSGAQNLAFMTAPRTSSTMMQNTASPTSLDLEQIHKDDLEAMDLKWQLSLLSVRAKKYYQRIVKKIFINANDIVGAPRSKEGQFRNQDNTRKQGNNEDKSSKAMKNEVLFSEEFAVLKREVACKEYEINVLKSEFEKVKQEKDDIDFKIEKFNKASKDLDQLLGSQITDKSKKGLGYSAVPPPRLLIYNRPNKSMFCLNSGLGKPQQDDEGFVDSGCSRHMTGNITYLSDFKEFNGGYVAFRGGAYDGRIIGK